MSDDSKQPERGVFAKRVKDLGSEVHDVRIVFAKRMKDLGSEVHDVRTVLILVANALARAGYLRLHEVRRIDKLLNADDGKDAA